MSANPGLENLVKLLILLLAMAVAGIGAYQSWVARQLYVQAALLSEGFTLTLPIKSLVTDYFLKNGVMPHENAAVGLQTPTSIFGTSVKRVAINRGGVLTVDYEDKIGAQAMTFTPEVSEVNGQVSWNCTSDSIARNILDKLKPSCDYLPATLSSQLMHAIANKDLALVDSLLSRGTSANAVVNGNTPLMLASKIGELSVVKRLLSEGADVDNSVLNAERRTPLMVAVSSNHPEIVAELLSRGASIERKDFRGLTAMDHALNADSRLGGERFVLMISATQNTRFAGKPAGASRTDLSAEKRRDEALRDLYAEFQQAGKSCHIQRLSSLLRAENELSTPELIAGVPMKEHIRKPACSTVLMEHIKTKSIYQKSLHAHFSQLVQRCDLSQAKATLYSHPALDVLRKYQGQVHLERAVRAGCADTVRMIVRTRQLGADLPDDLLVTAIHQAPQESLMKLVGNLIEVGANIDGRDRLGRTALGAAIALDQPVVAKYLVDAGANIHAETHNGSFPIIEASKKSHAHLVNQLMAIGADVNVRDTMGRTALFAAVGRGRLRLVESLISSGANSRIKDNNGIDPFVLAESRNMRSILRLLAANRDSRIASSE